MDNLKVKISIFHFIGLGLCIFSGILFWYGKDIEGGVLYSVLFLLFGLVLMLISEVNKAVYQMIFRSIAIGVFIVATVWIANSDITGLKSKSWPTVEGQIINSSYQYETTLSRLSFFPWFVLKIIYKYEVGGILYENDHVGATLNQGGYVSEQGATQIIQTRFYPGASAPVYYNPKNPSEAVLIPGTFWFDWFLLIFLASLLFYGFNKLIRRSFASTRGGEN